MKISDDGHLSLYVCDLSGDIKEEARKKLDTPAMRDFSYDAQVAAWYARQLGHRIVFVKVGVLMDVDGGGWFGRPKDVLTPEMNRVDRLKGKVNKLEDENKRIKKAFRESQSKLTSCQRSLNREMDASYNEVHFDRDR